MKYDPHPYQEEAIQFLIERGSSGLFLDPGLGKTSISLAALLILKKAGMIDSVLIIAPIRPMYLVWPKEIQKWEEFRHLKINILHGPDKEKKLWELADIHIINPEGLSWLNSKVTRKNFPWDMLIVDESTKFKHTNTQRFKILRPLLDYFIRRVILTGSPAANGLMDLFGQMYVMDRGATFGPYITHYRRKYFYPTGYGDYTWALRPGADQEIYQELAPRVLRMSEKDYLKLPPLTINDVYVDLDPETRNLYNQMETVLRLDFDKGRITAANTGVALMKCRQIAAGGVYRDDGSVQHIHNIKVEAVEELIEELSGQRVIIAYMFQHDLDRLKDTFGKNLPTADVTGKKLVKLEADWNAGELPILCGQISSISHGLNLQDGGNSMILITPDYNFEDYDQLIRRLRRQGQKKRVILHRIIARNTVDEVIIKSLHSKQKGQDALFDALKDYLKQRKKG